MASPEKKQPDPSSPEKKQPDPRRPEIVSPTIPCRDLYLVWHCARSTAYDIRQTDPDYLECCPEMDIGGVKQIFRTDNERFLAVKHQRAMAKAAAEAPPKRGRGRPRKEPLTSIAAE